MTKKTYGLVKITKSEYSGIIEKTLTRLKEGHLNKLIEKQ